MKKIIIGALLTSTLSAQAYVEDHIKVPLTYNRCDNIVLKTLDDQMPKTSFHANKRQNMLLACIYLKINDPYFVIDPIVEEDNNDEIFTIDTNVAE